MTGSNTRRTRGGAWGWGRRRSAAVTPAPRPRPRKRQTAKARPKEGPRARSARRRAEWIAGKSARDRAAAAARHKRAQARIDYLQGFSRTSRRRSARNKIISAFRDAEAREVSRARRRSASRRRKRPSSSKPTVSIGNLFATPAPMPARRPATKRRSRPLKPRAPDDGLYRPGTIVPEELMHWGPGYVAPEPLKKAGSLSRAGREALARDGVVVAEDWAPPPIDGKSMYSRYVRNLQRRVKDAAEGRGPVPGTLPNARPVPRSAAGYVQEGIPPDAPARLAPPMFSGTKSARARGRRAPTGVKRGAKARGARAGVRWFGR